MKKGTRGQAYNTKLKFAPMIVKKPVPVMSAKEMRDLFLKGVWSFKKSDEV